MNFCFALRTFYSIFKSSCLGNKLHKGFFYRKRISKKCIRRLHMGYTPIFSTHVYISCVCRGCHPHLVWEVCLSHSLSQVLHWNTSVYNHCVLSGSSTLFTISGRRRWHSETQFPFRFDDDDGFISNWSDEDQLLSSLLVRLEWQNRCLFVTVL